MAQWSVYGEASRLIPSDPPERLPRLQPVAELRRQAVLVPDDRVALGEAAQAERADVDGGGLALGHQLGHAGAHGGGLLEPGAREPPATNSPATPGAASSTARLSAEVS